MSAMPETEAVWCERCERPSSPVALVMVSAMLFGGPSPHFPSRCPRCMAIEALEGLGIRRDVAERLIDDSVQDARRRFPEVFDGG